MSGLFESLASHEEKIKSVPLIDFVEKQIAPGRAIMIGTDNPPTDDIDLVPRAENYHVISQLDENYIMYHESNLKPATNGG